MFNSTTLEVAIGMALVYLLLSLFCTAINEAVAGILGSRAKNLAEGIDSLFTQGLLCAQSKDPDGKCIPEVRFVTALYSHGLIQSLYRSGSGVLSEANPKNLPSYIPSRTFASALLDLIFPQDKEKPAGLPTTLPEMAEQLKRLPDGKAKEAITTLVVQAGGDIEKTRKAFEAWYDDGMDRAAGWYKRKTQLVLFIIGITISIILNVDSISVGRTLWTSPTLRAYAISAADTYAKKHPIDKQEAATPGEHAQTAAAGPGGSVTTPVVPPSVQDVKKNQTKDAADKQVQQKMYEAEESSAAKKAAGYLNDLQNLSLPIGWGEASAPWLYKESSDPWRYLGGLIAIAGWLLTGIAVTLGAPFWFDTLNQFMVVRSTIKPREKSGVEASKDSGKR